MQQREGVSHAAEKDQRARQPSVRLRPYHVENTPSRPIWQVKQRWARLVLGSETAWESRVWKAFLHYLVKFMNVMELSLISYLLLPLVFVYRNKFEGFIVDKSKERERKLDYVLVFTFQYHEQKQICFGLITQV